MNDAPVGPPPGWPTDEHRSRVEARAAALRNRRLALQTATVALVVVLLGGGFAALSGRGDPSPVNVVTQPSTTTTRPSPVVSSDPVPKGWRIVDVGDARLATPPSWTVSDMPSPIGFCADPLPTDYVVLLFTETESCPSLVVAASVPAGLPTPAALTIHGIELYLVEGDARWKRYAVPELDVTLDVRNDDATRSVLDTLTSSARRVVLADGRAPTVPDDWRTLDYGGITVRVPPTMPVNGPDAKNSARPSCHSQVFFAPEVFLGDLPGIGISCPAPRWDFVPTPTDGVWITTSSAKNQALTATRSITVAGLRLAITSDGGKDPILVVQAKRTDGLGYTVLTLGLGPDPTIARTILYSVRVAN